MSPQPARSNLPPHFSENCWSVLWSSESKTDLPAGRYEIVHLTWLSPSSWTSAEPLSRLTKRAETSCGGTCWTSSDVSTKLRKRQKTTEERWRSCDAASATSARRETHSASRTVSWEKLCEVQKQRESGKNFSGWQMNRWLKWQICNVQSVFGSSVWNDSARRRSRGWRCWRRTSLLLRRRWRSCGAAWEKLKGHDWRLDENCRSNADRSVVPPSHLCQQTSSVSGFSLMRCFSWLQLKVLDGEKEQKGREVAELQTRLSLEEQREEEKGREVFSLKQRLTEAETARDSLKKEVRMEESEKTCSDFCLLAFFTASQTCDSLYSALYDSETPGGAGVRLAELRERTDRSAAGGARLWEEAAGWSQEPRPARSGSSWLCRSVQPAAERGPGPPGRHRGWAGPRWGREEGPGVPPEQRSVGADADTGHRSERQRRPGEEPRGELHITGHHVTPPQHLTTALLTVAP